MRDDSFGPRQRLRFSVGAWRRLRAAAWVTVLLGVLAEAGCSVLGGDSYPATSAIQPLPKGEVIALNVTFAPQGSDNDGTRVMVIALLRGVTVATGESEMVDALKARGWTRSMCSPKGEPCAIVGFTSADLDKAYGLAPKSPALGRVESEVRHQSKQPLFMVWLGDV